MPGKHVFVETNWVVDCCAPQPFQVPEALDLLEKARRKEITLHLPGICVSEARNTIRKRFQPRNQLNPLRSFLRWAKTNGRIDPNVEAAVRTTFEQYETLVMRALDDLDNTLRGFAGTDNLAVFPLSEPMLERALSLAFEQLDLHPFDSNVLAAILIKATELKENEPDAELFFCELDADLQPWDKQGHAKPVLKRLYDDARIWVYGDFAMTSHERPADWQR